MCNTAFSLFDHTWAFFRSHYAWHLIMLVIICTKGRKNPLTTVSHSFNKFVANLITSTARVSRNSKAFKKCSYICCNRYSVKQVFYCKFFWQILFVILFGMFFFSFQFHAIFNSPSLINKDANSTMKNSIQKLCPVLSNAIKIMYNCFYSRTIFTINATLAIYLLIFAIAFFNQWS